MFHEVRWDEWSENHISRHDVTPEEVEQVMFTRPRWIAKGRDGTIYVFGRTDPGRHLLIVVVDEGRGTAFVVTARDMTDSERRTFRRKAR